MWINFLPQIEFFKVNHTFALCSFVPRLTLYRQEEYHLIVPDQRGTALSTHPDGGSSSGRITDVVDDYTCVLKNAGVEQVVCIGLSPLSCQADSHSSDAGPLRRHDWGSAVCHEAGRMRPNLYNGVVGVTVPVSRASAIVAD